MHVLLIFTFRRRYPYYLAFTHVTLKQIFDVCQSVICCLSKAILSERQASISIECSRSLYSDQDNVLNWQSNYKCSIGLQCHLTL